MPKERRIPIKGSNIRLIQSKKLTKYEILKLEILLIRLRNPHKFQVFRFDSFLRENTVISPLDRFELRVNKSTSSSLLPLRAEEPVPGAGKYFLTC